MSHLISVAMITMNEEKAVARVIEDIRDALHGRDFEIVVVDSSRDATPTIAAGQGARVIRQFPPQGYGRAMGRVLHECHGDVVVTLDCDGTYPAQEIPRVADMVLSGQCDLVNASRLSAARRACRLLITLPTGSSPSPAGCWSESSPRISTRECAPTAAV